MSDYEFENEEEEENETLGDKASWIGVANSTNKKFFLVAFMERTRETATGGFAAGITTSLPSIFGLGLKGKKDLRQLELGERMIETHLNINPETYTKVRVNSDTNQKSELVLLQMYKEKDGAPEEQPFFTDKIKVKHGVIIIDNPGETGDDTNFVIGARGQWRERNRWIPHSGVKMRGLKETYDPDMM